LLYFRKITFSKDPKVLCSEQEKDGKDGEHFLNK